MLLPCSPREKWPEHLRGDADISLPDNLPVNKAYCQLELKLVGGLQCMALRIRFTVF